MMHRLSLLVLALAAPIAVPAAASSWQVGDDATLSFRGSYMGEAFDGRFERFTAQIRFDPDALDGASFDVEIDVTSARTGIDEYDSGMQEPEFFHGSRFPSARFAAGSFRSSGEGSYQADAELTIRDQTRALPFPFRFEIDGDSARLTATVALQRLDFDVGSGDWADTSLIANEVEVRVDLPLQRIE